MSTNMSTRTVIESKYVPVQAPCLDSVSPKSILEFLKLYDRYKKAHIGTPLTLTACVDVDVFGMLSVRHANECANDEKLRTFLEEKTYFKSPEEALNELAGLHMDESIAWVADRLMQYYTYTMLNFHEFRNV